MNDNIFIRLFIFIVEREATLWESSVRRRASLHNYIYMQNIQCQLRSYNLNILAIIFINN